MKRIKLILYFSVSSLCILFFQNCEANRFGSANLESKSNNKVEGTGQPYDGKIFVATGASCPDGTFVQSRIVLQSSKAGQLLRENCKDTSRNLTQNDFSLDPNDSNQLIYQSENLKQEKPWTVIPMLASWYYQLTGTIQSTNALVYDIDMYSTTTADIQKLKNAGHIVICNFSAGTYEVGRSDSSSFNPSDIGNSSGASGEKWIDTRSPSVRSIMVSRLEYSKNLGCDGVDLDSSDGYANNSGFPLTRQTQIEYNQYLAFAAHDRHLIVALKNAAQLANSLSQAYDFAIAEQCFQFNECTQYQSFTQHGKAILGAEYTPISALQCSVAQSSFLSLAFFNTALDGSRYEPCP